MTLLKEVEVNTLLERTIQELGYHLDYRPELLDISLKRLVSSLH